MGIFDRLFKKGHRASGVTDTGASPKTIMTPDVKIKVDSLGRKYSISSDGPKAFLPGDWINDFINTTLKHQRIRNQEIRAQKHQERLWEIEDLKDRFGISD